MGGKRRDKKNRVLRNGESQRGDGRYVFKYINQNGKTKYIYSWKLVNTDVVPAGKKGDLSLREKEKQIQRDLFDGIVPNGGDMTVLQLVQKYVLQKTGVSHRTEAGYKTVINIIKNDPFGEKRIDRVRMSDAKAWLIELQKVKHRSYSSIHNIRGVARPAFKMAVDDDVIRKNPFDFELATVVVNDSVTREAITKKEERAFLKFVKEDNHFSRYYDGIYLLFKTGIRIGELCGLTVRDIDLEQRKITIDHQLQRTSHMEYIIVPPKTEAGSRILPMTDDVYECCKRLVKERKHPLMEPIIDGYAGFLYYNNRGMPMVGDEWAKRFQGIVTKYNSIYKIQMPKVSPHVCRHTYCSNMAKSGMNPKTLQYLMGHSDISVTLNTYTHIGFEDAKAEVEKLSLKNAEL